ncbi:MAG: sensor histidine kinase [Candidatus Hodarchaeales archaeon]|jgi:signal transduction histidine kinase
MFMLGNLIHSLSTISIEERRKKFIQIAVLLAIGLDIIIFCYIFICLIFDIKINTTKDLNFLYFILIFSLIYGFVLLIIIPRSPSAYSGSFLLIIILIDLIAVLTTLELLSGLSIAFLILAITIASVILPRNYTFIVAGICNMLILIVAIIEDQMPQIIIVIAVIFAITIIDWLKISIIEQEILQREKSEKKVIKAQNQAQFYNDLLCHDLNNINQGMLLSFELISKELESTRNLESISHNVERASKLLKNEINLINNVMKISTIENKDQKTSIIRTDIYNSFKQSQEDIEKTFLKEIQIKTNIEEYKFWVLANEFLYDIFYNLLHNAVKYSTQNPVKIEINTKNFNENFIQIHFKDFGPGIEDKQGLFSRLKIRKSRGYGIGLTLVKQIISSYGGDIWVEDRIKDDYSKGTKFVVLLPRTN